MCTALKRLGLTLVALGLLIAASDASTGANVHDGIALFAGVMVVSVALLTVSGSAK